MARIFDQNWMALPYKFIILGWNLSKQLPNPPTILHTILFRTAVFGQAYVGEIDLTNQVCSTAAYTTAYEAMG